MTSNLDEIIERGKYRVRRNVEKAFEKGLEEELSPEAVREWILRRLEVERQMILNRLMGVEASFGRYEIKDKDGVFAATLIPIMRDELQKILQEEMAPIIREAYRANREKLVAGYKKTLAETFNSRLNWEIGQAAAETGKRLADKTVREMREELKL